MGVCHRKNLFTVLVAFIFFTFLASHQKLVSAMRPLEGEQWAKKEGRQAFQSLQRGPVTPSGPNPCTNIPGQGSGVCINGMNVAGSVVHSSPAYPDLVVEVAVASTATNTRGQDQSS